MSTTVFVYTLNRIGAPGRWSRYVFPFSTDAYAQKDDFLYIRSGNDVLKVSADAVNDYENDTAVPSREVGFDGVVQWPWLDLGQPGVTKQIDAFDIVSTGAPSVALGYDQSNPLAFTTDYAVPQDTMPGMQVPLPVMAPSVSVRVSFAKSLPWRLQSFNLWVEDTVGQP